ncbi:MAG: response regulator transcription factor [Elusimicrobia bacterium]|nr:response regulator transcription factor [Elusimicrobiota bacterium]
MKGARVAVVEDEPGWLELLERSLGAAGFDVAGFASPLKFLKSMATEVPEAAVVDMLLPGMDGREVIRVLRREPRTRLIPIVAMTASEVSPNSAVSGITAGADEYFRKPFEPELLVVRLQGLLQRRLGEPAPSPEAGLQDDGISLSFDSRACTVDGKGHELTRLEFELLTHFLGQPGRVYTRRHLLDAFWPGRVHSDGRSLDKHVQRLRKVLGRHSDRLQTVYAVGYVWRLNGGMK